MINLSTCQERVLGLLVTAGIPHKIMGGYPRDLYLGEEPKDCDIAVFGTTPQEVAKLGNELEACGLIKEAHIGSTSMGGDARLIAVYGLIACIDIICWQPNYRTWLDVAQEFDFNLNMFVMQQMGKCPLLGIDQYEPQFVGDNFGTLEFQRSNTISELRLAKMQAKARDFHWEVDEDMALPNQETPGV